MQPPFRVGFGFDVHQLVVGRPFWLGGILVEHDKGALGHSDADVLIHAICDALLGSAGLKDIGHYFPDTDQQFKNIDSKILLQKTVSLIHEKGYQIGNVDCALNLEQPKIKQYINQMIEVLAPIMQIEIDQIAIKATTMEKMGFVGREEGITASAVVLIYRV